MEGASIPLRTTIFAVIAAGIMYAILLDHIGEDMVNFLLPWFDHIRATGPVVAFAHPFGNYAPPYLYLLALTTIAAPLAHPVILIKLLSLAGAVALIAATWRLLTVLGVKQAGRAALIMIAMPSLVINTGLLAQCDAMWAAACVMALAAAVERKHGAMLGWCGLALAIKLQPAFSAPLIVALLIGRQVPVRLWPIAPLAFVAAMLPAWAEGWPAQDLASIYTGQAGWSPALSMNAPNVWAIVQALPWIGELPLTGLAIAAAVGASAWLIARFASRPPERTELVAAALLVTLVVVGLLPRMHERFFFMADVLALTLALARGDRRNWLVFVLVQSGSMLGLTAYLTGIEACAIVGAVPMIVATTLVARQFLVSPANDNGLPLNPFRAYPA